MDRGRSTAQRCGKEVPTQRELRKYAREFVRNDLDMDGRLTAAEAKQLFGRSGLSNDLLGHVWNLVDVNHAGFLGFQEFVGAMHLIRAARGGLALPPSLPPALVGFIQNLHSKPQDLSLEGSSRSASASRSRSGTPRKMARAKQVPSQRDCRKYAREFQRTGAARSGVLDAEEAKSIFLRSGLGNDTLMHVYSLADRNLSGRLGFVEFVLAMHFIRLAREGEPLPLSSSELSPELLGFLNNFGDSPADLARQGSSRSASRTRSESAMGDRGFDVATPGTSPDFSDPFAAPATDPMAFDLPAPQFSSQDQPQLDVPAVGRKKEKKRKDKQNLSNDPFGQSSPPFESTSAPPGSTNLWSEASVSHSTNRDRGRERNLANVTSGTRSTLSSGSIFRAPDPELAHRSGPSTRMGLPVPDPVAPEGSLRSLAADVRGPHYTARVREILGLPEEEAPPEHHALASSPPRHEARLEPSRVLTGDYSSPVMWTVLMGAKPTGSNVRSRAAEASVQPPSGAPFLRTIAPNYRLGEGQTGQSHPVQQPVPSGALALERSRGTSMQLRGLPQSSFPSAQVLREQLSALPAAYTSQVPMHTSPLPMSV